VIIYHPDYAHKGGARVSALTQTTDLMPTLLDFHGVTPPPTALGRSLRHLMEADGLHHDAVLYGMFGAATNITDGRYTYFRYPEDMVKQDLYEYTLMPTHLRSFFSVVSLREATLREPFTFTREIPVLKIPARRLSDGQVSPMGTYEDCSTVLFDLHHDPEQVSPITNPAVEQYLLEAIAAKLEQLDAPEEAFARIGLNRPQ
jgi:hypothetical protein